MSMLETVSHGAEHIVNFDYKIVLGVQCLGFDTMVTTLFSQSYVILNKTSKSF